jgi:hypothetical protein
VNGAGEALKREMAEQPEVQAVIRAFDAQLLHCTPDPGKRETPE